MKQLLELQPGLKVLDIPCGHGRLSNKIAKLGCEVVGVDASQLFIEKAKIDALTFGVIVDYQVMDMRNISWFNEFDRIIVWFNSFGYFDDEENFLFLQKLYQALKPGGFLLIEQVNRDRMIKILLPSGTMWTDAIVFDQSMMIDRAHYDELTGRCNINRIVVKNGVMNTYQYAFRLFTYPEIHDWLKRVGFSDVIVKSDNNTKFDINSKRMIVISKKNK